jgi:hypothetical protein
MKTVLTVAILAALTHASGLMPKVIRAVSDFLGVV